MRPKDIGGIVAAGSPTISPDGTRVSFVVSRVDEPANRYRSQVWLAPVDGHAPARPVTAGDRRDHSPAWSPDSRWLVFASHRSEKDKEQTIHVMPAEGPGETITIATVPGSVEGLTWSLDGQWLAFASPTPAARYDEDDPAKQPPRKITRFFSRLNDEGWVYDRPSHIYVVPADGTEAPQNLTPGEFRFTGPAWLPDSSGVVCTGAAHETWDLDLAEDLYLVPLDGGPEPLTKQTGVYADPSVSPDGRSVAYLGYDDPLTFPQNSQVWLLDLTTGERRCVSGGGPDRPWAPYPGTWAPIWDGDHLVAVMEDRGNVHVYRLGLDGGPPELLAGGERTVTGFDHAGGVLAFTASWVERPAELFVVPNHTAGARRTAGPTSPEDTAGARRTAGPTSPKDTAAAESRVTTVSERFATRTNLRPGERFTAPSTDGVEVDAWLITPPDLDPVRRYPVLLNVHGGPFTQYGNRFFDEAQIQAAAGYVVVMGNPRGSSGRDNAWGQAINGSKHPKAPGRGWGSVDVEDVLATLDEALRRYSFADPDRVGMLGGSYGGYMATWLAGTTTRFKAICTERAVNNLLSEEWNSDIATTFRVLHGPNHVEDPDLYQTMSPIRFVRDIDTPLLIIHSEDDLRCPINQAEELFVALRLLGKEAEFHRFPAESHELSRSGSPAHRIQRMEIILDFFGRHLGVESSPG